MATFLVFLLLALLSAACYFIYQRSTTTGAAADEQDLQRIKIANRELLLERIDPATWETALQIAHGDEGVARARYVELRVRQMKENEAS